MKGPQQDRRARSTHKHLPRTSSADSAGISSEAVVSCGHTAGPCPICKDMGTCRVVGSEDLLQGQRALFIVHGSEVYRLFRTRNDKLILQK